MTQTLEHPTAIDRLKIYKVSPELYDAMMKLSTASAKDVDPTIGELIKIRATRSTTARSASTCTSPTPASSGETEQRLALVAAWEEAGDAVHRARAGRAGADRGHHRTAPRPRLRRGLRQGRRGVHREGTRPGDRDGRHHQRVEPVQRRDPAEGPAPLSVSPRRSWSRARDRPIRPGLHDRRRRYTQYGTRERYCRMANAVTVQPTMVSTMTTTQCRSSWSAPSSGARTMST